MNRVVVAPGRSNLNLWVLSSTAALFKIQMLYPTSTDQMGPVLFPSRECWSLVPCVGRCGDGSKEKAINDVVVWTSLYNLLQIQLSS
jgi:hypothetical protein